MTPRSPICSAVFFLSLFAPACGEVNSELDGGFFSSDASGSTERSDAGSPAPRLILVDAVFDGDTIRVRAGSGVQTPDGRPMNDEHVRLLGIDAPEIAHPPEPADCWGNESAAFAGSLLGGQVVNLDYDLANGLRDNFGRLLAYVILSDARVANEVLIQEGQARSFRAFRHRETARYNALEQEARDADRGLWTCP